MQEDHLQGQPKRPELLQPDGYLRIVPDDVSEWLRLKFTALVRQKCKEPTHCKQLSRNKI